MQLRKLVFTALFVLGVTSTVAHAQFAHTQGKEIVDGAGKPLLLRGINLGNWLVAEGYMWHLNESSMGASVTLIMQCVFLCQMACFDKFSIMWTVRVVLVYLFCSPRADLR